MWGATPKTTKTASAPGQPAGGRLVDEAASGDQRGDAGGDEGKGSGDGGPAPGRAQDGIGHRHHQRHYRQRHQHRPRPAYPGDEPDGGQAGGHVHEKTLALADEVGLFLLEGPQLAGVVEVVADVPQGGEEVLGPDHGGVVVDQGLLVRQAHRHLVHPRVAAQGLLDGAGAEGAVKAGDAGPDASVAL